jgi:hypothetical protein
LKDGAKEGVKTNGLFFLNFHQLNVFFWIVTPFLSPRLNHPDTHKKTQKKQ